MRMSLAGTNLPNEQPENGRAKVLSGHAARRTDEPHPIRFMVPMRFKKEMEASHEPALDEIKTKASESQPLPTRGEKIRYYCANAARKALRCPVDSQVRLSPLP